MRCWPVYLLQDVYKRQLSPLADSAFFLYQVDITASAKNIKKALKSCSHIENYAVIVHLDVYKRQTIISIISTTPAPYSSNKKFLNPNIIFPDVYKRQ